MLPSRFMFDFFIYFFALLLFFVCFFFRFPNNDKEQMVGLTCQQRMLIPPLHKEVHVSSAPVLFWVFLTLMLSPHFMIDIAVKQLHLQWIHIMNV